MQAINDKSHPFSSPKSAVDVSAKINRNISSNNISEKRLGINRLQANF